MNVVVVTYVSPSDSRKGSSIYDVVITTAKLHSTKPELRFCAGLNPACGVQEICNDENL